jgi:hypothetical protein
MGPRELGWFFRLAASPEPERDRFFHTRKRGRTQVSKGLKRTAGRENELNQILGPLIFLAAVSLASTSSHLPIKSRRQQLKIVDLKLTIEKQTTFVALHFQPEIFNLSSKIPQVDH